MYKKARFGIFMLLSVLVVFSMLLSACAKKAEPTEAVEAQPEAGESAETQPEAATPTKLVVASFYPLDQVSGWAGMVEKFKAEHPGVEIEVQVTGWNDYMPKLLSQIAAGDPPDVAGVENSPFPAFVEKNMLTDLTPYMEKTSGFNPKDFFPHLLDRYTYEGKVYGIPYDAQPYAMLFFNPSLFDAAGVAYPTADTTWPELVAMAKKLTVTDASGAITQYGIVGANEERAFIFAWNGRYVDDLRNPTKCMLDSAETQKGLQFMVDMMYTDKVTLTPAIQESLGGSSMVDLFVSGKSAMLFGGFWNAVENPEGFAAINAKLVMGPTGPDGNRLYATGGTAYTVLNGSKNPDLAWEFIQYFMGKVGTEEAYKSAKGGAIYPPGNIDAFDWYMQQPVKFVDTIQADKDALGYIMFAPYNLAWNEINDKCITPNMDLIKRNTTSVEEGTQTICTCVNDMLK
jgi:multiple sugar transport system substrate-binding protein